MQRFHRLLVVGLLVVATIATTAPAASAAVGARGAVRMTNHDPGRRVDVGDLRIAMKRIHHHPGSRVDRGDLRVLVNWARRAAKVRATAVGQVGDPYRWGATGPHAFDCSGLTGYAYRSIGVNLPRTSRGQAAATRPVSRSRMLPGDLIFYGSPVHHVAMYIGRGRMVHARRAGRPVVVVPVQWRGVVKVGRVLR